MRIKVGNTWFSPKDHSIMVELTDKDKENITNMPEEAYKYAQFPDADTTSAEEKRAWMRDELEVTESIYMKANVNIEATYKLDQS